MRSVNGCHWPVRLVLGGLGNGSRSQLRLLRTPGCYRPLFPLVIGTANMGKQQRKRKLPARRRPRRAPATDLQPAGSAPSPDGDVTGKVVNAILVHADSCSAPRDAVVILALRSCLKQSRPQQDEAGKLYDLLEAIRHQESVSPRAFRDAVNELIELSRQHDQQNGRPDQLVVYLSVLAQ